MEEGAADWLAHNGSARKAGQLTEAIATVHDGIVRGTCCVTQHKVCIYKQRKITFLGLHKNLKNERYLIDIFKALNSRSKSRKYTHVPL
jgi:hypothetical protein